MKIIDPLIDPKINLSKTGFFFSSSSRKYKEMMPVQQTEQPVDFTVERARIAHTFWIRKICEVTVSSVIAQDTGISGRSPETLETKMKKGEAVIAFASDGRWAGFAFISIWENGNYVLIRGVLLRLNSGIPGLQKKLKERSLNWAGKCILMLVFSV